MREIGENMSSFLLSMKKAINLFLPFLLFCVIIKIINSNECFVANIERRFVMAALLSFTAEVGLDHGNLYTGGYIAITRFFPEASMLHIKGLMCP